MPSPWTPYCPATSHWQYFRLIVIPLAWAGPSFRLSTTKSKPTLVLKPKAQARPKVGWTWVGLTWSMGYPCDLGQINASYSSKNLQANKLYDHNTIFLLIFGGWDILMTFNRIRIVLSLYMREYGSFDIKLRTPNISGRHLINLNGWYLNR